MCVMHMQFGNSNYYGCDDIGYHCFTALRPTFVYCAVGHRFVVSLCVKELWIYFTIHPTMTFAQCFRRSVYKYIAIRILRWLQNSEIRFAYVILCLYTATHKITTQHLASSSGKFLPYQVMCLFLSKTLVVLKTMLYLMWNFEVFGRE